MLCAFQATFRQNRLVAATADALTKLYDAFKPLVVDEYPTNPFATFTNRFGFLDATPATTAQVRFMQYYWDLFDDLLAAYDELRWKGVDLMCACCPPEGLFPRHLMAGVLDPVTYDTADYRHRFVPSPAVGDCEDRTREVRLLFRRLVAMLESFTEAPPDKGVRATPSRWGDVALSAKAIPYYYDQDGTPPVFELWDPRKTARRRANQNLSYRADEYAPARARVRHRPAAVRPRTEQLPADRGAPRQERPERARDAARAAEEPSSAVRGDRAAHRGLRREHRRST